MDVLERMAAAGVVPVVVLDRAEDAVPTARAMVAGGIDVMEITFRTAAAADSIRAVAEQVPEMLVGAGTVINLEQCKRAVDCGAKFIVAPGYEEENETAEAEAPAADGAAANEEAEENESAEAEAPAADGAAANEEAEDNESAEAETPAADGAVTNEEAEDNESAEAEAPAADAAAAKAAGGDELSVDDAEGALDQILNGIGG